MRSLGSGSVTLALFVALAVGSVGLKAAAGPAPDGSIDMHPGQVAIQLAAALRAQGFYTQSQPRPNRSELVFARRGSCLLAARDARGGTSLESIYAADTRRIGPVRYLYRGQSYDAPPAVRFRIGRLENELLSRLGLAHSGYIPVALSTVAGCGPSNFGLDRIRVST